MTDLFPDLTTQPDIPDFEQLEAWSEVYYDLEDEAALWAAKDPAADRWLPLLGGRGQEYADRLNALLDAFPKIPVQEQRDIPMPVAAVIRFVYTA
jgi:hypothetical protein